MNLLQIAKIFEETAVLLELKNDNPFRIRAFYNAAKNLKAQRLDTESFIEQVKKTGVKGFGSQLTDNILALHTSGDFPLYEELRSSFPEGLLDLFKIPGLGPKKIKILYQQLGLTSIPALRDACLADKISLLPGFGSKTQENILQEIERYSSYQSFFLLSAAQRSASEICNYLDGSEYCDKTAIVGSLRRKTELHTEIDILASSKFPAELIHWFAAYPEAQSLLSIDGNNSSLVLSSGMPVNLHVVSSKNFATSLLRLTGSKDHLAALSSLAADSERRLDQAEDHLVDADSEETFYHSLSLAFIEPELRENRGELERSASLFSKGRPMPRLIEQTDIKGILHVHSTYSDGVNSIRELALSLKEQGYHYLGISDHSQSAAYAGGLSAEDIRQQHEEIDILNEELKPFKIFKGIESDILADGSLDYPDSLLKTFDFIIASIHSRLSLDRDQMTERILSAISHPLTSIIGHISGRLLLRREPYSLDIEAVIDAASRHNVAIEINANPKRLDLDWRYHQHAKERGVLLPICPDAHSIKDIANLSYGVSIARKGGLTKEDVLNSMSCAQFENYLSQRRSGYLVK